MMNQREATYNAVQSIHAFDDGDTIILTKDEKAQVVAILCAAFEAHEVTLSEKACNKYLGNPQALKGYVGGLVNNWTRKDPRMNGNTKYQAKNPGSRAGSGDSVVKNLKLLRSTMTDEAKVAKVDEAIEARQAEIKATKAKDVEIDFSVIDPDLLTKLGFES
jgi:hypothetical protein